MITINNIFIIQDKQVTMAPIDNNNQINQNIEHQFHEWKLNLDSIFQDVFHTTSNALPDMPYWDMFQEKVEENLIVLRMFQLLNPN